MTVLDHRSIVGHVSQATFEQYTAFFKGIKKILPIAKKNEFVGWMLKILFEETLKHINPKNLSPAKCHEVIQSSISNNTAKALAGRVAKIVLDGGHFHG